MPKATLLHDKPINLLPNDVQHVHVLTKFGIVTASNLLVRGDVALKIWISVLNVFLRNISALNVEKDIVVFVESITALPSVDCINQNPIALV